MSETILIVDDEANLRQTLAEILRKRGYTIQEAADGTTAVALLRESVPDLIFTDWKMPEMGGEELLHYVRNSPRLAGLPVIVITAFGSSHSAIEAVRLGAYDFITKPFDLEEIALTAKRALPHASLDRELTLLRSQVSNGNVPGAGRLIGSSGAMMEVFKMVGKVAETDSTVLICGESGTGKELVAEAIHNYSQRKEKPFVVVNCAAIPEQLLETELFGHERGAFTGAATQRIGRFEQCHQGTIFLDEIGDMTHATQTKILRGRKSGTFERVGGNQPIQVDVRVIAATNKPLEAAVAAKQFREDLFYRLNVVRIPIPPLRERPDDIPLLVNYFLEKNARELKRPPKSVAASVIKTLEKYHWPGNVRELENAIRRAHVMAKSDAILLSDLPPEISGQGAGGALIPAVAGVAGEAATSDAAILARQLFQWARRDPKLKV